MGNKKKINNFKNLCENRNEPFRKDVETENFLTSFNYFLKDFELSNYKTYDVKYPFIFVFGPPRSCTTMCAQLIAYYTSVEYINNFVARFWLCPVTGIKLFQQLGVKKNLPDLKSNYAATPAINGLHEFGYFWRHWLQKETFESVKHTKQSEKDIDWQGLLDALSNIQNEVNGPMVLKNIWGAYHLHQLEAVIGKIVFIYIQRDDLDTSISILNARRKINQNIDDWWSTLPPNYEDIIDLDHWHQIAGQVHYLKKYYNNETEKLKNKDKLIKISYQELCNNPLGFLNLVKHRVYKLYKCHVDITGDPSPQVHFHTYADCDDEKKIFTKIFNSFSDRDLNELT